MTRMHRLVLPVRPPARRGGPRRPGPVPPVAAAFALACAAAACQAADPGAPAAVEHATVGGAHTPTGERVTGKPFDPARGRRLAWREDFTRRDVGPGRRWGWKTAAYPDCLSNPGNFKLDVLSAEALSVRSGELDITATDLGDGRWRTGLVTTGDSCDSGGRGFEVRSGDVITARVRFPSVATGAWPSIWTWRQGRNEIDVFEWHADRPDTLEFVNHVNHSARYWSSSLVQAGKWLDIAVRLGERRLTWYLGHPPGPMRTAYADRRGVGPDFHAHLVAAMAVDDGDLHALPERARPFTFQIASLTVHRPR
ncbi:hypothetical protein GEV43_46205 [Actinomadura sp. J1-007]|nr:hypothetical protein [Actinomadura sp. J1-007]